MFVERLYRNSKPEAQAVTLELHQACDCQTQEDTLPKHPLSSGHWIQFNWKARGNALQKASNVEACDPSLLLGFEAIGEDKNIYCYFRMAPLRNRSEKRNEVWYPQPSLGFECMTGGKIGTFTSHS